MSKFSRDKGSRFERELVNTLQEAGFASERVPLSGAAGGRFSGDITFPLLNEDRVAECKKRSSGFKQIYQWLEDNFCLFVSADRSDTLVVLRMSDFLEIARKAEQRKGQE